MSATAGMSGDVASVSEAGTAGEAPNGGAASIGGSAVGGSTGDSAAGSGDASAGASTAEAAESATGSIGGVTLDVAGAYSYFSVEDGQPYGGVTLADLSNLCATAIEITKHNSDFANARSLLLSFAPNNGAKALELGSYPVIAQPASGHFAQAQFAAHNAQCSGSATNAISGSIVLTNIDAVGLKGTFSLNFPDGDVLSGAFNAPACNELLTTQQDPSAPAQKVCNPNP